ncbi:hypothetical protein RHGRI_029512 [Rhododendron griersonianum]|uniref:DUF659 domain-containing protein n=1 Tax=Rhododendron griersonianum TaxID=479676 RepID=A0AAV6IQR0_9ERIC|nr:hypothetical protein RHGRI_029512 [Rhododendron griersonianum]
MFLKAVNCEGETKDKHFIASLMKEVVIEIGTKNVVHNLALKNICAAKNVDNNSLVYDECSWINITIGDASIIKNFIMNHSMRLAIFNEFVPLKLLAIAETRFASSIVMLKRACDTDKPTLHLIYDMWDTMIEKVKCAIYKHEEKHLEDESEFYDVVHKILVDRWNKNNTPLHCLAHALNPRYFDDSIMRTKANMEYAKFSTKDGPFADIDSIEDMWTMDPHSCNLRLLSRRSPQYCQGQTKMWDIAGDQFGSLDEVGMLEVANLSLDEPEMEAVVFTDDGDEILEESMEVGSN